MSQAYRLTERAEADVEAIADFIAADSIDAAVKVVQSGDVHLGAVSTTDPVQQFTIYHEDSGDLKVTLAWDDDQTTRESLLEAMAGGGFRPV